MHNVQGIHSLKSEESSLSINIRGDSNSCDIAESEYVKLPYHPPMLRERGLNLIKTVFIIRRFLLTLYSVNKEQCLYTWYPNKKKFY
jgi:hypothetical protein